MTAWLLKLWVMAINKTKLQNMRMKAIIAILLINVFSSCSLQKRLYTKGFYSGKNASAKSQIKEDTLNLLTGNIKAIDTKEKKKKPVLLADKSANKNTSFLDITYKLTGGCDTIVLRNGAKINANVSEISQTHIKFKNCGATNEPDISMNKDDINYIILSNGQKEVFEPKKIYTPPSNNADNFYQPQNRPAYKEKKKQNGFSIAGFVLDMVSFLAFIIVASIQALATGIGIYGTGLFSASYYLIPFGFAFIALIFSIKAIYQISQDKESRNGLALAIVSAVLSLLLMLLIALIAIY